MEKNAGRSIDAKENARDTYDIYGTWYMFKTAGKRCKIPGPQMRASCCKAKGRVT
jgi:hypothetical protein